MRIKSAMRRLRNGGVFRRIGFKGTAFRRVVFERRKGNRVIYLHVTKGWGVRYA